MYRKVLSGVYFTLFLLLVNLLLSACGGELTATPASTSVPASTRTISITPSPAVTILTPSLTPTPTVLSAPRQVTLMVSLKGKGLTVDQLQLETIYFPRYASNDTNVQLNFEKAAIQEFTENGKFASDCALVTGVPSTNSTNRSLAVTSLVPLPNSGEQNQKVGVLNVSTKQSPTGSNRTPEMLYSLSTPSGEVYQLYFEELVLQKYSDLSIFNNKPIFTSGEDYSKRWGAKSNNRFVTELTPLKSAQPVKLTGKFQEFQHGDYGYCLSIHVGTFNLGFKDVTGKSYPLVLKENDYGVDLRKAETITINADYYATEDGKGAILYLKSVD